jgi:hypothetical protein
MPRFIIAGIVFLYLLPLFYPAGALAFMVAPDAPQNRVPSTSVPNKAAPARGKAPSISGNTSPAAGGSTSSAGGATSAAGGATSATGGATSATGGATSAPGLHTIGAQTIHRSVVNIIVDRIEEGTIYSKDGRTFQVPSFMKVIDNTHPATKMRTAELVFQNGKLVAVSIK